ncbi:MAG: PASTA domain-containing protein [Kurthia sp.]|nr:PASTA domain-containing protein [Candidatus Kurthia equi]
MSVKKSRSVWGAFLMLGIFGFLFLLMFFRIFYIQVTGTVEGQDLALKASQKQEVSRVENANRGNILDTKGEMIATNTTSYKLYAVVNPKASEESNKPLHVVDKRKTAKVLSNYIQMSEKKIYTILTTRLADGRIPYQVEFSVAGRDLSHRVMVNITNEKLPGINFEESSKRFYPNGLFASNIVGFSQKTTKEKSDQLIIVGRAGLEKTFNSQLAGVDGEVNFSKDKWGYLLPSGKQMVKPPQDGNDIYLTIDKTIQNILESEVSKVNAEYSPQSIVAVVANPKTGEILGSTQRPTYNAQTGEGINTSWLNRLTETTIEPGSTMKIFTLATAIEQGVWNENATFMSGQYTVGGTTIRDSNQVGWGRITYLEGIQRSSNVGMANLLTSIGSDNFIKSLNKFGFGEQTGIDLPNEASGKILNQYKINAITTTYGQGSTVTPIQLIQAATAVANNGKMMQPYVIKKIVNPNTGKVVKENEPKEKASPISATTAKEVRRILATTITAESGTAKNFASKEYIVSGKTGTAQIANNSGGYDWGKGKFLYSFLGMAPEKNPQLVMYIAVEKPRLKASEFGSEPTSKIFNAVMQSSLKYMNVETETSQVPKLDPLKDYTGQDVLVAQQELTNENLMPIIIGQSSEVTAQYPQNELSVLKSSKVFLKTSGQITLPNFKGWSLRDILAYKEISGLKIQVTGNGYVTSQNLPKGMRVDNKDEIKIKLKTPSEIYSKAK